MPDGDIGEEQTLLSDFGIDSQNGVLIWQQRNSVFQGAGVQMKVQQLRDGQWASPELLRDTTETFYETPRLKLDVFGNGSSVWLERYSQRGVSDMWQDSALFIDISQWQAGEPRKISEENAGPVYNWSLVDQTGSGLLTWGEFEEPCPDGQGCCLSQKLWFRPVYNFRVPTSP